MMDVVLLGKNQQLGENQQQDSGVAGVKAVVAAIWAFFGKEAIMARRAAKWEKMTPAQQYHYTAKAVGYRMERMKDIMPDYME